MIVALHIIVLNSKELWESINCRKYKQHEIVNDDNHQVVICLLDLQQIYNGRKHVIFIDIYLEKETQIYIYIYIHEKRISFLNACLNLFYGKGAMY